MHSLFVLTGQRPPTNTCRHLHLQSRSEACATYLCVTPPLQLCLNTRLRPTPPPLQAFGRWPGDPNDKVEPSADVFNRQQQVGVLLCTS